VDIHGAGVLLQLKVSIVILSPASP
jgi:hypothetical protein